ncbi:MAG: cyclic nucleotide-binding domain-containing protein [Actinomycetota bacterium]|nr:cyclic nucleotide-binding domain-containing protein [Actinomycetota bacterium]
MESHGTALGAALRGGRGAHGPDDPRLDLPVEPEELTGIELLAGLPWPALRDLAGHARRRRFRPGEIVFREGDQGESMHVVTRGQLSVVRPSRDPGLVLQRLFRGDVFGEVGVLNAAPRLASIVAIDQSETVEVRKEDLDRVLDADPKAMRQMLGTLAFSLTLAKEELARHNSKLESKVRERTADLRESQLELVRRLAHAAESRDDSTGIHITRMSRMCAQLALDAGMGEDEAQRILHASSMHDIGKIAIPDRVLLKEGPLGPEEWEVMKTHTTVGAQLLAGSRSPVVRMAEVIARTHHEKWDGTGYPEGLRGEEIPLVARMVAVCDVFDALVSDRPYKDAWLVDDALAEIERIAGTHLDPELARLFAEKRPDLRAGD